MNPSVFDTSGNPVAAPPLVYADDDIYLNIADVARFERTTAAGIEAIFILPTSHGHRTQYSGTSYST